MKASILLALLLTIFPTWIMDPSRDKLVVFASNSSYGCDFDGDMIGDLSVWDTKRNVLYFQLSTDNKFYQKNFFNPGVAYTPVFADYDGDSKTDFGFFHSDTGQWIIFLSSNPNAPIKTFLGNNGDIPIPLDLDGDMTFDAGVWRPSNGIWVLIKKDETGKKIFTTHDQGYNNDTPITGDFDGDGKSDLAIFRPDSGYWFIDRSSTNYDPKAGLGVQNGKEWDVIVPNDYDGDKKTDLTVWRPKDATWYITYSNNAGQSQVKFGEKDDIPISIDLSGDSIPELVTWNREKKVWNILNPKTQQNSSFKWDVTDDCLPASSILQTFQ